MLYTVYNVLRAGLRVVKLLEQPSSLSVFSSKAVRKLQRQFKEEKTKTMSLPRLSEAERKFWRMPDLLERLLAVLDAKSVLALVKGLPPPWPSFRGSPRGSSWSKGFVRTLKIPDLTVSVTVYNKWRLNIDQV